MKPHGLLACRPLLVWCKKWELLPQVYLCASRCVFHWQETVAKLMCHACSHIVHKHIVKITCEHSRVTFLHKLVGLLLNLVGPNLVRFLFAKCCKLVG